MLFELKWSLPENPTWLEKELVDLNKYNDEFINWKNSTKKVDKQEVILICNILDVNRVIKLIEILCTKEEYFFLKPNNICILGWSIVSSKRGEREEELRIERCYGKTTNKEFERLLDQPTGIIIPEEVLQFLRFQYFFIKQKPPIQYTISVLIQHILNAFPEEELKKSYKINIDIIYERAKIFFPSWEEYDRSTKQIKRNWINEAMNVMCELGIIKKINENIFEVPKPLYKKRKLIQESLCKDLSDLAKKRRKLKIKIEGKLQSTKTVKIGPLDQWVKKET